jgi:YidC/Oxa1 family membrane protein insertase
VSGGFLDALPYFVLVGFVILTGFLQARQNRRNSPNMTNQMAMITNILPIAFGVFSLQFPAGLVLYFLVSNLWRLGQQEIILRKITRPGQAANAAAAGGAIDVKSEAVPEPKGPGGLRKLFQLPAATNGDTTNGGTGNGVAKADGPPAKTSGTGSTPKGKPAGGGTQPPPGGSQQSSSQPSGRRSNKKRKRR